MPSITYADKDKNASGAEDMWRDVDANEVKTVVNAKQDGNVNLSALASIVGTSGFFKKTGPGTWILTFQDVLLKAKNKPSHGFTAKDALTLDNDGLFIKISLPSTQKLVALCVEVVDVDNFIIALPGGYVTGLIGLTQGAVHYCQTDGTISTVVSDMPALFADGPTSGYLLASGGGSDSNKIIQCADWDASGVDLYPSVTGTGVAGAIRKGNQFDVSVADAGGLLPAGATIRAKIDTPGQTDANWRIYY